ncbi:LCP family protein [Alloscardovia macacae]|uniref:Transcriptional regulator n=1 Tax=Alloscardovia macacae TaxID=1160091 RepID=A0A261F543_9BIFI|nr:LCP family protein [Alloscardovia macacae]OZG54269.1 transcriptional regulator [Alloscardovia macacae]
MARILNENNENSAHTASNRRTERTGGSGSGSGSANGGSSAPSASSAHTSSSGSGPHTPPPSFAPVRSRTQRAGGQGTGSQTHAGQDGSASGSTPPAFSPRQSRPSRQSRGSSRTVSAAGYDAAPRFSPSEQRPRPSSPAVSSRGNNHSQGGGRNGGRIDHDSSSAARAYRGSRGGRILRRSIAIILALLLAFGGWLWFWVDGQLNRTIDLTPSSDNSGANSWLILGSDAREGQTLGSADAAGVTGFRNDTILVLTKPRSGPASLISIPRDSYVEVAGQGMKINGVAQYAGYDALIGTVEGITGTKIDHVAQIGFDGIASIVDALGGVELCYDSDVNDANSSLVWTAGCHVADGATSLAFARMRYSDPEGDIGRAKRQRQVISAIMKKSASVGTLANPAKAMKVASASFKALSVDKNASTATMLSMALAFRDATGAQGVTGSVYFDNLDYEPGGIGSAVHLDASRNTQLFQQLNDGSIAGGTTVGGYTG